MPAIDLQSPMLPGQRGVETHGADTVLAVKSNCPDTYAQLEAIYRDAPAMRRLARRRHPVVSWFLGSQREIRHADPVTGANFA